ncbi:unnamed protein product [Allacma fusca]|uniref:Uncharacterized protein n=1 Tax=Allacma fusca TaxID=39272 RepID=A0A8J2KD08_9HEXA|nr:unnamed protein product [Allacma fusca]
MTREIFSTWIKKLDLRMRFKKRKIVITHNEEYDESMDASSDEEGEDDEELERTVISNGTVFQYLQQIKTWYLAGDNDSTDF